MTAVALLPEIPQLTMYNMGDDDGKMANIKRSPFDGESTEAEKKKHTEKYVTLVWFGRAIAISYCRIITIILHINMECTLYIRIPYMRV